MRRLYQVFVSMIFSMILASAALSAAGAQKGNRTGSATIVFAPREQAIINEYFQANTSSLPPGLAKRGGNLPPGLQKQLRRNGQLPPGLQKQFTAFPQDLDRRLAALPAPYQRGTIGDRAIIYNPTTAAILDVIQITINIRR
jgi:hypothetical protein